MQGNKYSLIDGDKQGRDIMKKSKKIGCAEEDETFRIFKIKRFDGRVSQTRPSIKKHDGDDM